MSDETKLKIVRFVFRSYLQMGKKSVQNQRFAATTLILNSAIKEPTELAAAIRIELAE